MQLLNLSAESYFFAQVEIGCALVALEFDENGKYYQAITRDKNYWNWFCTQWLNWEAEYLPILMRTPSMQNYSYWYDEMYHMIGSPAVYDSFYKNYLKQHYDNFRSKRA